MGTLTENVLYKLGMGEETSVIKRTEDLTRRLELRSTNLPQINEYGKIVLCAHISAEMLDLVVDMEMALRISGLSKSVYANAKRMYEKLLDLSKIVGVNDICTLLNLNEFSQKSEEIFELYKRVVANKKSDVDMCHPQYAAMAVYQACKLYKKKISKAKMQSFSNLRPSQWSRLEQLWDKFMVKNYKNVLDNKIKLNNKAETARIEACKVTKEEAFVNSNEKRAIIVVENYTTWKTRMLNIAETKLRNSTQAQK